jgi:hypothetical protein
VPVATEAVVVTLDGRALANILGTIVDMILASDVGSTEGDATIADVATTLAVATKDSSMDRAPLPEHSPGNLGTRPGERTMRPPLRSLRVPATPMRP